MHIRAGIGLASRRIGMLSNRNDVHVLSLTFTIALTLALCLAGSLACESMPGGSGAQPTMPWSQQLVTQLSAQLEGQLSSLYDTALKEPEFAGERSAYGSTLDNLRKMKEEATGLHAKLKDGKGYDDTLGSYERLKEISRDTRESESWEFLPDDFRSQAETTLSSLDQLDAYFGAR